MFQQSSPEAAEAGQRGSRIGTPVVRQFLRLADVVFDQDTWILTTTDKKALDAAVGASGVIEIVFGEPYGVGEVVEAVRRALKDGRPEARGDLP